jgi:hypothetical protein
MKKLIPALFILIVIACNNKKNASDYGSAFSKIIVSDDGLFRGAHMGEKPENIKAREKANLIDEDGIYYLYYDESISETDFYNVAYYFDESGLYEIMFDANFEKQGESEELFNNFSNYYTDRFGQAKKEENYHIWKTSSGNSKNVEIALVNNSTDNGGGYLSLIITNYDY